MEQEIIIRRLSLSDIDQLYSLFEDMVKNDIPEIASRSDFFLQNEYSRARVQSSLIFPKIMMFGAFAGKELVGFIWGSATYAGLGFISWLKVANAHKKKGIGTKLVKHYEEFVRSLDGHVVELYCFDGLKDYYLKLGYEIIGKREKGYFKLKQFILNKYLN